MSLADQIVKNVSFLLLIMIAACGEQNKQVNLPEKKVTSPENTSVQLTTDSISVTDTLVLDQNIRSIFQDKNGNYWFGTNGAGVYFYDRKTLRNYTTKDGLCNNQVLSVQEDLQGNIWLGTGAFGVNKFDGKKFVSLTDNDNKYDKSYWKSTPADLWFYAGDGAYRFDGHALSYLPFVSESKHTSDSRNVLSPSAVYCILKDKKGNVWFGTQAKGVCRFDGKSFTWFTEKGLSGSAVLGLFEDSKGNIWMGNNGAGLFCYDGKSITNITHLYGLDNNEFKRSGKSIPGTLARVYTINEDNNGNILIGAVDTGVWKYDGRQMLNYTTKDGLSSNAVNTIFKDSKGELWFGTDNNGICKFYGSTFTRFVP